MDWLHLMAAQAQTPAVEDLDRVSHSLERGGLYTVCTILLGMVLYLFVAKERQQAKFQDQLLKVVEETTKVITKQALLTEKVEGLLARVTANLERSPRRQTGDSP